MQAYIDDSKGPPVFVLAGFIARTDQWSALTARWHDALDLPPRLKYFKMHEAHTCTGEFTGWKQTDRDVRLASLAGIIKDHVVAGVSSVVRQDDYDEIMAGRIAKPLDYPYWLMYYSIIMRTLLLHRENGLVEKTDFIFDEQPDQSRQVQEHFNAVYDLAPPQIKELFGNSPLNSDDKTTLPLQAADMFAWHIHRCCYERERGFGFDSPTMQILHSVRHYDYTWTRERLQALLIDHELHGRRAGKISIHENRRMEAKFPADSSLVNLRRIARAVPNSCVPLTPFPAKGTKRFLLVDSCPFSRNPHLHRRSGNKCLLEKKAYDPAAGSELQQQESEMRRNGSAPRSTSDRA
jgi:uncharacterized protein DUF3800